MRAILVVLGCSMGNAHAGRVCHASDVVPPSKRSRWVIPRGCSALDVSFTALGPDGMARLADALMQKPVRTLNLTWTAIGVDGLPALTRAISSCPNLLRLDLSGNWLGSRGLLLVLTALGRFKTIEQLHLRWNGIRADGTALLRPALSRLTRLKVLDLGGNWLVDVGLEGLVDSIGRHSSLRSVRLDYNGIGLAAVRRVAAALAEAPALERIDLGGNGIDDKGVQLLIAGLKANTALESLTLHHNRVSDPGASALAAMARAHPRLTRLDLAANRVSGIGAQQLLDAFEENPTLKTVELEDNNIARRKAANSERSVPGVTVGINESLLMRLRELSASRNGVAATISNGKVVETGQVSQAAQYWRHVYPLMDGGAQPPTFPISFLYVTAPATLLRQRCEGHAWSRCRLDAYFEQGRTPPQIEEGSSFAPFRLPPGACMQSLFKWGSPTLAEWEASYPYRQGINDHSWGEVAHTREQTGGAWLYLATGSGVFWNCGRSLRARNKVAAAAQLLMQRKQLTRAKAFQMLAHGIQNDDRSVCGEDHCRTFMAIYASNRTDRNDNCYGRCHPGRPLSAWLKLAADGNGATAWWYDHMSASSVFDHGLYKWAKQLKYDSVQLTMQPQVWCGIGWTTELLDLRVRPHRIIDLLPHLSLRNPHSLEHGEPCVVRNDNISRKAFQVCVYCEGSYMERNARCIADASRGKPKFTIYSTYPRPRFDACLRAHR